MVHLKRWYLCLLTLLLTFACGEEKKTGFVIEKIPDPMQHNAYVSNPDHLISPETEQSLNEQMRQLDQSGRAEVAIVLLETIGERVPKDVAHDIFKTWKPGQKDKDNGLVVLLVNDQHRIEFETGYGLEGDLPDVICFRIQQSEMLPSFKAGNIDEGMLKGMTALVNVLQPAAVAATDTSATGVKALVNAVAGMDSSTEVKALADAVAEASTSMNTFAEPVIENDVQPDISYTEQISDYPGIGTLILYVVYALFATIFVVRPGITKRRKNVPSLFKANVWHKIWLYGLPFVLLLILINLPGLSYHWWMAPVIMYINLLAYLCYRAIAINTKASLLLKDADRHQQYEALNMAHMNAWISAALFPLPLLVYSRWNSKRLHKLRYDAYDCDECQQPMSLLKKGKKKDFLEPVQLAEDKVGSVIYDAWYCQYCDNKKVLGYVSLHVDAEECPSCKAITLVPGKKTVIKRATTSSEGHGMQYYDCKFCQFTKQEPYTIPRVSSGSSSSSSSGSSGSSSSSGSWGGGSSGGGGAGSSW